MTKKAHHDESALVVRPAADVQLLLVEDERHLADSVARRLQEEGYGVDVCHDGEEALALGLTKKYHLIILDLLLPRKDGIQVLKELRRASVQSMVLILTAKSTVEDRVEGLRDMLRARDAGHLLRDEADFQLQVIYLWYEHNVPEALSLLRGLRARRPHNPLFLQLIAETEDTYLHDITGSLRSWQALLDAARAALSGPAPR